MSKLLNAYSAIRRAPKIKAEECVVCGCLCRGKWVFCEGDQYNFGPFCAHCLEKFAEMMGDGHATKDGI